MIKDLELPQIIPSKVVKFDEYLNCGRWEKSHSFDSDFDVCYDLKINDSVYIYYLCVHRCGERFLKRVKVQR